MEHCNYSRYNESTYKDVCMYMYIRTPYVNQAVVFGADANRRTQRSN